MTTSYTVDIAVPRPVPGLFSYLLDEDQLEFAKKGNWARVPFGRSTTHAYIAGSPKIFDPLASKDKYQLKSVIELGPGSSVIPEDVFRLCEWIADYYQSSLGEVLNCAAPAAALGLRNKKRDARAVDFSVSAGTLKSLTDEQEKCLASVFNGLESKRVVCLEGVTGSGKTELYIEAAKRELSFGKSVLYLVPEISLTPHTLERVRAGLGVPVLGWHSAMPSGERRDAWAAVQSGDVKVVLGARSAVFAPLVNLGLIIVDEEHDSSFKQDERVRYHARDVALVRASQSKAKVILGSATPSLETLENVKKQRFAYSKISKKFGKHSKNKIEIIDLNEAEQFPGIRSTLARETVKKIQNEVDLGNQVLVYLNRRGFASFALCQDCKTAVDCPNCSISLTYYKRKNALQCHVCGHQQEYIERCQKCSGSKIKLIGAGTESLESELKRIVSGAQVLRLDRDKITSVGRLEATLDGFRRKESNILVGTQMLVKGHDFPDVTLVVVVLADGLFRLPDYRSPERAYQTLVQVSGRSGRAEKPGSVVIQTYSPDHPTLKVVEGKLSIEAFLSEERELRKELAYPPFCRLAKIRVESTDSGQARYFGETIKSRLSKTSFSGSLVDKIEVLGPSEAFLSRAKGKFRWDLTIRGSRAEDINAATRIAKNLAHEKGVNLIIDVDPLTLI